MRTDLNIPHKTGRILNLILLAFLLIFIRVWHLSCVQGDYHKQKAKRPQRRSWVEKVDRATIRDRFNIPLAQNSIDYGVAVRYADIRDIPAYKWVLGPDGKKRKEPIRAPYISSLAQFLAKELDLHSEDIEDLIYAKASLFPHTPFQIKNSLTEQQYYKLRGVQKDWMGLEVQRNSKRVYPKGSIACDIVGYMGSISTAEYVQIAEEIKELETYVKKREAGEVVFLPKGYHDPLEVRKRLSLLKEKAYTIDDRVGKSGIEKTFDETLRGIHGRKTVEIDPKGTIIRELPSSKKGISGQRVFLSISSELQSFAEDLLAESEKIRDLGDPEVPWIKGGAIVAMDPKTGEVFALASYPKFNPNDFIDKNPQINQWMENETHIGNIWNGKTTLTREIWHPLKGSSEEKQPFHWDYFLSTIIPANSPVKQALQNLYSIEKVYFLQKHFSRLLQEVDLADPMALIQALYPEAPHIPCKKSPSTDHVHFLQDKLRFSQKELQESLSILHSCFQYLPYNDDKLLLLDLTRLLVKQEYWTSPVLAKLGNLSLSSFFSLSHSFHILEEAIRKKTKELHHSLGFKQWKDSYFKEFLKKKRQEEKAQKKPAKPYTEYLEKIERTLFSSFWPTCRYLLLEAAIRGTESTSLSLFPELAPYVSPLHQLLDVPLQTHVNTLQKAFSTLSSEETIEFLKVFRNFEDLTLPLYGKYSPLRHHKGMQLEKHLASAFYPIAGFGYGRSQAFRQSTPIGSVFKLVVAYEALKERYEHLQESNLGLHDLNPLTLSDLLQGDVRNKSSKQILGYTLDGQPIRRFYKGGLMPRSSHSGIGKVDLVEALEQSSNIYFSILASEHIEDVSNLEQTTRNLGFGKKTGIELQGEFPGNIPNDLADNKTGLYAFAIGQHSLVGTPLQTGVMLSSLGNEGKLFKPQIVRLTAGKNKEENPFAQKNLSSFPFQEPLSLIGIDFPLFTESLTSAYNPCIEQTGSEEVRSIFLPEEIKEMLFDGMNKVISGKKGTARPSIVQALRGRPQQMKEYVALQGQLIGKTGTAEVLFKNYLTAESKGSIHNHVWFGGLLFPEGSNPLHTEAELAIVVYLKFSLAGGREAAPIAAQIAKKWRELQKKASSEVGL